MRLGALFGPVSDPSSPTWLADQARAFERAGYSSLWSAQAIGRGFMMTDPFVALTVAASVTRNAELGTAIVQLPLYAPADLAHRTLSLAQIAGNRLIAGVGAGSTVHDFDVFDRNFDTRFAAFDRDVKRYREFLRDDADDGVSLSPWPTVAARVPVFLGSWGAGVERAAREFDGWIASAHYRTPDEVCQALGRYRATCLQANRPGRAVVSTIQVNNHTDLGELSDRLAQFADAGFDDAVVMLLPGAPAPEGVRKLVD